MRSAGGGDRGVRARPSRLWPCADDLAHFNAPLGEQGAQLLQLVLVEEVQQPQRRTEPRMEQDRPKALIVGAKGFRGCTPRISGCTPKISGCTPKDFGVLGAGVGGNLAAQFCFSVDFGGF